MTPHDMNAEEGRAFAEECRKAGRVALINNLFLIAWLVACFLVAAIEPGSR